MRRRIPPIAAAAALVALLAAPAVPAEVRFFRLHTREAFLGGTLDGLSVDPLGTLRLADRAERLAAIGEPFLFSAAPHPDGWVLGTGNDGKVMLVDRAGEVRTLFAAPEPEVFAVWADADGTVFAGTLARRQGLPHRRRRGRAVLRPRRHLHLGDRPLGRGSAAGGDRHRGPALARSTPRAAARCSSTARTPICGPSSRCRAAICWWAPPARA